MFLAVNLLGTDPISPYRSNVLFISNHLLNMCCIPDKYYANFLFKF